MKYSILSVLFSLAVASIYPNLVFAKKDVSDLVFPQVQKQITPRILQTPPGKTISPTPLCTGCDTPVISTTKGGFSSSNVAPALLSVAPVSVSKLKPNVIISEIMYDPSGADTGREWIEVQNRGSAPVNISDWKLFENNTNHGLTIMQGSATIQPMDFAVLVDDPTKFLLDLPSFSGTLFDSAFSLSNTGESISLKMGDMTIDEVVYTNSTGGNGNGDSIQKINGVWDASRPTPGLPNVIIR